MEIGVKFYPDSLGIAKRLQNEVDFFEVMTRQDDKKGIEAFDGLDAPVMVIHSEHLRFGVNISDKGKHELNIKSVRFAQEMADRFGSRFIILHPGIKENEKCSLDNAIDFYKELGDRRIITENMPYNGLFNGQKFETFGRYLEEIIKITESGIGFCFDFGHCWSVAYSMKKDPVNLVKEFIQLKPSMYHFSDSIMNREIDSHLSIGFGDADTNLFKSLLPNNAIVTLETEQDYEKQLNDVKFMKEKT